MSKKRPHVLGIDDAPFDKDCDSEASIVGVVMEGSTIVEGVAVTSFPVDGREVTAFLVDWTSNLKWKPTLDLIVLGGITIAGLGMVDLKKLARDLGIPAVAATRHDTSESDLDRALKAAGLEERLWILDENPPARRLLDGLYVASAGACDRDVDRMVRKTLNKALLPEPLRVAHLMGAAMARGSSRGKV